MQSSGILCEKVTRKYGELKALKGINLSLSGGGFLVLFGPNGAGKTTLMKILSGIITPTSGKATIAGNEVGSLEVRSKVGVISHNSYLYDNLSAKENLLFFAEMYGIESAEESAEESADRLLQSVELFDRKDDLAKTFSRGMTQRLSIARALISNPQFIFLDEPFSGLDVHSATIFRNLLLKLHEDGKTMIMITHDIPIGYSVASHIAILKKGEIVYNEPQEKAGIDELKKIYIKKMEE